MVESKGEGRGRGGGAAHGTSFPIAVMRHLAASQEERKEGASLFLGIPHGT